MADTNANRPRIYQTVVTVMRDYRDLNSQRVLTATGKGRLSLIQEALYQE